MCHTFSKSESESDAPSKGRQSIIKKGESKSVALFQKVGQKVTPLEKIRGFRGICP